MQNEICSSATSSSTHVMVQKALLWRLKSVVLAAQMARACSSSAVKLFCCAVAGCLGAYVNPKKKSRESKTVFSFVTDRRSVICILISVCIVY